MIFERRPIIEKVKRDMKLESRIEMDGRMGPF
jgi:hypothetical protein